MAFTPEDGTGLAGANSYISEADADSYWTERGNPTEWAAATQTEKENALVQATDYLDSHYTWIEGEVVSTTQALGWPRTGAYDRFGRAYDTDEVPSVVEAAVCRLAQKVLEGDDLAPDVSSRVKKEKVGPLEVEYTESGSTATKSYVAVDDLLIGLVTEGTSILVGRA